jgi:hypothetical protein
MRLTRELKLRGFTTFQAICRTCSYSGAQRDTRREAETDAESHVTKPGRENHRVSISTIETSARAFKSK